MWHKCRAVISDKRDPNLKIIDFVHAGGLFGLLKIIYISNDELRIMF